MEKVFDKYLNKEDLFKVEELETRLELQSDSTAVDSTYVYTAPTDSLQNFVDKNETPAGGEGSTGFWDN